MKVIEVGAEKDAGAFSNTYSVVVNGMYVQKLCVKIRSGGDVCRQSSSAMEESRVVRSFEEEAHQRGLCNLDPIFTRVVAWPSDFGARPIFIAGNGAIVNVHFASQFN